MSEKDFDKGYKSGFKFGKEVTLDKVKKAKEKISKSCYKACITDDGVIRESKVLEILDRLIESEE